ncbi:unnamed protein product [Withania somnifera]
MNRCKFNDLFALHLPPLDNSLYNRLTTRLASASHPKWPAVCQQLFSFTSTSMGISAAKSARIPVGRTPEESSKFLSQTSVAVAVPRPLDFSGIEDVSSIVDASVAGAVLSIRELCSVKRTLEAGTFLLQQLEEIALQGDFSERYSPLKEILHSCDFLVELEQKIEFCTDCSFSVILDRATEELEIIRSERKRNMDNLESLLKILSTQVFQGGGFDRPLVTKQRSRMCGVVRALHRSLLPNSVILDTSSKAVKLNNMEVKLSSSERAEEQTILSLLTSEIAESNTKIKHLLDKILDIDLAFARAAHAQNSDTSQSERLSINVEGIQHPLLLESSLRDLSTDLSPRSPIWIKEMSLEQSLSTFSGHISRRREILEVAFSESLVLIDEIGSGTDPSEGVALSESILQYLKDRVDLAVVTSHYADLNRLKEKDSRFETAATEFSFETLQRTYRTLWGSMGESNALNIAKSMGFDERIIERAALWVTKLTPDKQQEQKGLLYRSLIEERDRLESQATESSSLHSDIMNIYSEINNETQDLDGREEALDLVQRIRSLRDLGSLSEANKNQQDSYGPVLQTSKNTIDLRGLRVEDASHQLNIAIDSRAPNSVIFIIHGMGTGVVKESALKLLRKHPCIVKFEQESPMNYGCTVVYIK